MSERYPKLLIALRYYLLGKKYFVALKALDYARGHHKGVRKDGTTPEFSHQVEIALYLTTLKGVINEELAIAAALLHDVKEDYNVPMQELVSRFGQEIADICDLLDKKGKSYEVYFARIAENASASLVKGADRIHNVNSMKGVFTKEKQKKYIGEVSQYFLPMLKTARNQFPEQIQAYFNIEYMLRSQMNLLSED